MCSHLHLCPAWCYTAAECCPVRESHVFPHAPTPHGMLTLWTHTASPPRSHAAEVQPLTRNGWRNKTSSCATRHLMLRKHSGDLIPFYLATNTSQMFPAGGETRLHRCNWLARWVPTRSCAPHAPFPSGTGLMKTPAVIPGAWKSTESQGFLSTLGAYSRIQPF